MFTNRKREEEGGIRITPTRRSLCNIYIYSSVCVFTFKLFFFVVKQEFSTEASTDLRRRQTTKKKKERKDCTLQSGSVMHEKKRAKNDDAFRCSREVL
jgi:hypothetical protein